MKKEITRLVSDDEVIDYLLKAINKRRKVALSKDDVKGLICNPPVEKEKKVIEPKEKKPTKAMIADFLMEKDHLEYEEVVEMMKEMLLSTDRSTFYNWKR